MGAGARFDVSILGDRELQKRFDAIERGVAAKVMRKAIKTAATKVLETARYLAPHRTGRLSQMLRLRMSVRKRGVRALVQTGSREAMGIPASAKGFYPAHRELGAEDDPATPYLRPALEQRRAEALRTIRDEAWRGLEALGLGREVSGD